MVRSRRLELPRELPHSDLNAARLPIPPRPHCLTLNMALSRPSRRRAQGLKLWILAKLIFLFSMKRLLAINTRV